PGRRDAGPSPATGAGRSTPGAGGRRRKRAKGGRSGEGRRLPVGEDGAARGAGANHAGNERPRTARCAVFATRPLASVLQFRQVSLTSPYSAHFPSSSSPASGDKSAMDR